MTLCFPLINTGVKVLEASKKISIKWQDKLRLTILQLAKLL